MTATCSIHLNRLEAGLAEVDRNRSLFSDPNAPAKPRVAAHAELLPTPVPPYSSIVEMDCDDCGGTGSANGKNEEYEPCHFCNGSCKQAVLRNWLAEAFQIETGQLNADPQREHLQALRYYARLVLNAYNERLTWEVA
jgi:endogenous inhibitor of DNA gyrase (YacG/DUF329 family)